MSRPHAPRPKVSLVVPVYNQAQYLPICLDSIWFQDYPDLEVILVNDGSTDHTDQAIADYERALAEDKSSYASYFNTATNVIERVEHPRFPQAGRTLRVIRHEKNRGLAPALNTGFAAATGEFCTYVPADDVLLPSMLSEMVDALEAGADFVYADMAIVDDAGRVVRRFALPDYSFERCFGDWYLCGVAKLYRTALHARFGNYDEALLAHDHELFQRFAEGGARFAHIPRVLMNVRDHARREVDIHAPTSWNRLLEESKVLVRRAREQQAGVGDHAPRAASPVSSQVVSSQAGPAQAVPGQSVETAAGKVALITGITGQDGAYLAELLLCKGYTVHGIKRRSSLFNTARIDHLYRDPHESGRRFILHHGDMTDSMSLLRIIQRVQPDEVYNLAAQSHVAVSFEEPEYTANSDALGALRMLESIRILGLEGKTRFYQASTSELYGLVRETPQSESTPFYPRSPYAAAKLYAYWITVNYREAYGIHASNGILFNHESPVRGETFVTRKITRALARIKLGMQDCLYLGNLSAKRDWGHAKDYVEAMWLMLQQDTPDDYVIASGQQKSVRDFINAAARELELELFWRGEGLEEQALDAQGVCRVAVDPRYFRPTEVETLLGDGAKARERLGWTARTSFEELVAEMASQDLSEARRDALVTKHGYAVCQNNE